MERLIAVATQDGLRDEERGLVLLPPQGIKVMSDKPGVSAAT
jgi:hypothetical protein